jgi:hypothetical protein
MKCFEFRFLWLARASRDGRRGNSEVKKADSRTRLLQDVQRLRLNVGSALRYARVMTSRNHDFMQFFIRT